VIKKAPETARPVQQPIQVRRLMSPEAIHEIKEEEEKQVDKK